MSAEPVMTEPFKAAWQWQFEHAQELHDRHEEQWVAIAGGGVVASGRNPRRVEAEALRQTGLPRGDILVRFVESSNAIYSPGLSEL
jgi:hypothetical protein